MIHSETPRRLLRINEAASYAAVSRATLYNEIKAGRLTKLKIGKSSRIEISEINRWIDAATSAAQPKPAPPLWGAGCISCGD
ncbi:MAG: helix-turn-helix domain-containing protein [Rhodobacteraceae bacterium]|nr:helix-turn-helix domain-containing protein [Paracoccaceae bacterium]